MAENEAVKKKNKTENDKRYEAYLEFKALGHKRKITPDMADKFGVSVKTMYNWRNRPIEIDGKQYDNWEAAYKAETEIIRERIDKEISDKLSDSYKLEEAIVDKALKKLYMQLDDDKFTVSVDDIVKLVKLKIERELAINGTVDNEQTSKTRTVIFKLDG